MADNGGKDVPMWAWILIGLVVVFVFFSKKTPATYPTGYDPHQTTRPQGQGRPPDRDSASSAIGSFFGSFLAGFSSSSSNQKPDTDADEEYDTSRYRVYDD